MAALVIILVVTMGLAFRARTYSRMWSPTESESAPESGFADTCARCHSSKQPAPQIELDGKQSKGKFYDFAAVNKALSPGGVYSARFRSSTI